MHLLNPVRYPVALSNQAGPDNGSGPATGAKRSLLYKTGAYQRHFALA